ncbi:MAG: polysaccharide deacetylase family protein [Fimbriimonas sp.]
MLLSLAYEGLPPDDLRLVGEALAEIGARATFFVNPPKVLDNLAQWQSLADGGHEIANAALSGVSLSGELVNWTLRMVEQDLHMTQSFLEDIFNERAVPVFAYPGPFTRCADGDYRIVVESMFTVAVTPGEFEQPPSIRAMRRVTLDEVKPGAPWSVVSGPRPQTQEFDRLREWVTTGGVQIVPVYEAAQISGRAVVEP